jgi:hypothetical protein
VKTPLSERIRPNSEVAPWVLDEVKELEKQNTMMLDTLKRLTKYTKALDVDCSLLMGSRVISTEERDQKSMWAKPIIESCEMIAYVEGEGE